MAELDGLLVDIDGVLVVSWQPVPGAPEALARLRQAGVPLRLLTNTTSRSRARIGQALGDAGLPVELDEIVTAPVATATWLASHRPDAACWLLNSGDIVEDLRQVRLLAPDPGPEARPDVVVLGGAGDDFTHARLGQALRYVLDGAELVAMHRSMTWRTGAGLELDTGAFLVGLEQATGVEATVVGKPSPDFFTEALASLDVPAGRGAMVGDDVENDVLAAQGVGLRGILVRTGKFRQATVEAAAGRPDEVIDSFADLPDLLGI